MLKIYGITVDIPVVYRFVNYKYNETAEDEILLGTFHEWNSTYYIDVSADLYKISLLDEIVIHETRHMIVEYLKDKKIIDLTKYTEEIASQKNSHYNNLFDSSVYLLLKGENNNG